MNVCDYRVAICIQHYTTSYAVTTLFFLIYWPFALLNHQLYPPKIYSVYSCMGLLVEQTCNHI